MWGAEKRRGWLSCRGLFYPRHGSQVVSPTLTLSSPIAISFIRVPSPFGGQHSLWGAWQCWAHLCLTTPTCHPQTMDKGQLQRLSHPLGIGQAVGVTLDHCEVSAKAGEVKMATAFLHR